MTSVEIQFCLTCGTHHPVENPSRGTNKMYCCENGCYDSLITTLRIELEGTETILTRLRSWGRQPIVHARIVGPLEWGEHWFIPPARKEPS